MTNTDMINKSMVEFESVNFYTDITNVLACDCKAERDEWTVCTALMLKSRKYWTFNFHTYDNLKKKFSVVLIFDRVCFLLSLSPSKQQSKGHSASDTRIYVCEATTCINAWLLSTKPPRNNLSEISVKIQKMSFNKMQWMHFVERKLLSLE